jgi:hypothetical protein
MVLQGRPCGRVERRQIYGPLGNEGAFFIGSRGDLFSRAGWRTLRPMSTSARVLSTLALLSLASCDPFAGGAANAQGTGAGSGGGGGGGGGGLLGALGGAACPELAGGGSALRGNFTGEAGLNAKIGAFVQAAKDLVALSGRMDAEITSACQRMGSDLGVPAEKMQPAQGVAASTAACNAVSAEIGAALKGGASLKASFTPPKCEVNAAAQAGCEGQCKVDVSPAEIVAKCDPGKLSGQCKGTCKGQCDGTCNGTCQGECSVKDASGKCAGQCKGTCQGSCSATCHASCQGEWQAPKCEGSVTGPKVDADCKASCNASAKITAQCSKPALDIQASANAEALGKVISTLRANLPVLVTAQFKIGKEIAGDLQTLVRIGGSLRGELKGAGGKAMACVTAAASAVASASVSVNVSFKASASVSGKAGVGG